MKPVTLRAVGVAGTAIAVITTMSVSTGVSQASPTPESVCAAMNDPVQRLVKPGTQVSTLAATGSAKEIALADGFVPDGQPSFAVSDRSMSGLIEIHQLSRPDGRSVLATGGRQEWRSAVSQYGFEDQGTAFYAYSTPLPCLVPVYRFRDGATHRLAVADERAALESQGWSPEGVAFFAAPVADESPTPTASASTQPSPSSSATASESSSPTPTPTQSSSSSKPSTPSAPPSETTPPSQSPTPTPTPTEEPTGGPGGTNGDTDGKFTLAFMPDTQNEVLQGTLFDGRAQWLAANRDRLDLEFVGHSGDMVNWDTPGHEQYELAQKGFRTIEQAEIPYSVAIGNHDTGAVAPGGSAKDPKRSAELIRDTSTFNSYFKSERYGGRIVSLEPGKVDNVASFLEIEGTSWMFLTLELYPRKEAVAWAADLVADNPDANVVVLTHHFLDGDLGIGQSNGGYGATSPQYLWDNVIGKYANVKIVVSGHVGVAGTSVKTGANGNKVYAFLNTFHSAVANPVRLMDVDTKGGTLNTNVTVPVLGLAWVQYRADYNNVSWVR